MGEVLRVSEEAAKKNAKSINAYMLKHDLSYEDMAKVANIPSSTIRFISKGYSRGTIYTWRKVEKATGLHLEYDRDKANALPAGNSKSENYLVDMVLTHLNRFGNTCLDDREIEKLGGIRNTVKAIQSYGAPVKPFKGESGWCVELVDPDEIEMEKGK